MATQDNLTTADEQRVKKQQREELQFQRMYQAIDQGKSPRPSVVANAQKTKNSINLNTIQQLLEKDMVKKMPIKLKAQLRQTQDIADAIIGEGVNNQLQDLDPRSSIRLLPIMTYRNGRGIGQMKKQTITHISSSLIKQQVRKTLESSSNSSSSLSSLSNSNDKSDKSLLNKKKSKKHGIANTRNLLQKMIRRKEREINLQKLYKDYAAGNIVSLERLKEEEAEKQLFSNAGVDQAKVEHRISLIQAKNKQIDSRVNLELDRKFKKSLAGTNLKNQIQHLVEQVAKEAPRESLLKLETKVLPQESFPKKEVAEPAVKPFRKLKQSKSVINIIPLQDAEQEEEQRQIREDAQKFVQMARYSLLPHISRKDVNQLPQIIMDADNLFKKRKSSKTDSKSNQDDRSSDTTRNSHNKSQTLRTKFPKLDGTIIQEESMNESTNSIKKIKKPNMPIIAAKKSAQKLPKKSTQTKISELIKTCSSELPPFFLNTMSSPLKTPLKYPGMFEQKINPKLNQLLNRNKNEYLVAAEKELEQLSQIEDNALQTIKDAQKDIHFELFANSNDYSRLFQENIVVTVNPLATEENKDYLNNKTPSINNKNSENDKKDSYRRIRLRMFEQMESTEEEQKILDKFLQSQNQHSNNNQIEEGQASDPNYFSFGLASPQY